MGILTFNQALHGYADGHQLLASSFDFTGAVATKVLILSDVSGPAASIPDSGYLTAYPLAELGQYAVAATWSASEMPRPGCVWTHTIFIPFEDLAAINDCLGIKALFKRPDDRKDLRCYQQRIAFLNTDRQPGVASGLKDDWLRALVDALYSNPSRAIVVRPTRDFDADTYILSH